MTIIAIIFKSYSSIMLAVGGAALCIFALGSYLIIRLMRDRNAKPAITVAVPRNEKPVAKIAHAETLNDVSAISGEDPLATQLDLAKAYIESGKAQLARIILAAVIKHGDAGYQEEARRLLSSI